MSAPEQAFSLGAGPNNFVFHLHCFQEMIKPPGAGRWWAASRDCSMSRRNGSGSLGVPAPRCAGQGQGQTVFLPSCEEGAGPRGDTLRSCPSPWSPGAPGRHRPTRGGRAHGAAQSTCRGEAAAVWQEGFAMMRFVLKWLLSPGRLLCLVPVFQPRGRQAGRQLMVADRGQLLVALRTRFSGGG